MIRMCWKFQGGKTGLGGLLAFAALCASSAFAATEATSEASFIFLEVGESSYWHTATNNVLALPVEFPDGASSATLTVSAPDYMAQHAIATEGLFTLTLPAATSPTTENVYDLTLAFNDAAATVHTARLGLIEGYDTTTEGLTRCLAPATARKWGWVRGRSVIPIPHGMTSFTVDGVETDTLLDGEQGWYPILLKGGESTVLSLDNGLFSATLFRPPEQTTLIIQ